MLHASPKDLPEQGASIEMPEVKKGTYPARILHLIYLGQQKDEYKGEETVKPKLMVFFEVPSLTYEIEEDGKKVTKTRTLIKEFTVPAAYNEKSHLISLHETVCSDGETYADMVNKPLLVTIGHTSGKKPKVSAWSAPIEGMTITDLSYESVVALGFEDDLIEKLPGDFVKEKVAARVGD